IEHTPPVVVPPSRWCACAAQDRQRLKHALNRFSEFRWNWQPIQRCQQSRMQKEIQCIDMVISRLFKIETVGPDLSLRLSKQNFPPLPFPLRGSSQFGAQYSDEEQCHRFAK